MKKVRQSYKKHDPEFNTDLNSIERALEMIIKYDGEGQSFKPQF